MKIAQLLYTFFAPAMPVASIPPVEAGRTARNRRRLKNKPFFARVKLTGGKGLR